MQLRATVLGGGSWGSTVASLVARNTPTLIWARNPATVDEINRSHSNEAYLPGARLSQRLTATADFEEAVSSADVLIVGVPAQTFRSTLVEAKKYLRPWVPVISLAKGLEQGSRRRMTQIIDEILPGHPPGVLSGPNLAREILAGSAAASVIAMEDETIVRHLKEIFGSGLFRVYTNTDVVGCELGGALKNVVAIAVGMGDGLNAGDNTRAAVITRGLAELTRLLDRGKGAVAAEGLWGSSAPILAAIAAERLQRPLLLVTAHSDEADDLRDDIETASGIAPDLLPQLDSGLSTLVHDLKSRGLLRHTVIVVMGAYGRSPRIGTKNRRAPWTRSWSLLMGGGGLRGGRLVGQTTADGARVTTDPISFEDVWITVAKSMGIAVDAKHVTRSGRPIRIFNGGQPIRELLHH